MAVITLEMLVVGGVFLVLLTTIVLRARAKRKKGYKTPRSFELRLIRQTTSLITVSSPMGALE